MSDLINRSDFSNLNNTDPQSTGLEIFLAKVKKVYLTSDDFNELKKEDDFTLVYNGNKSFHSKDTRYLGAIEFQRESSFSNENYAFPFDKNNVTYPIVGETVFVIKNSDEYFWLPYTVTQYPNFREDFKTSYANTDINISPSKGGTKSSEYQQSQNTPKSSTPKDGNKYSVKEKIKFLKPKNGDTILQGRVGNTIRFSESFLVPGNPTDASPSIIIRNRQTKEHDSKSIGELVEEDINKDGSSLYITSDASKIPFKEEIKKDKVGFTGYPSDYSGDQIFLNSDRILLSAKAKEFIIFGKGNTGIITDGRFSVDAKDEIYMHNEKNITIHTKTGNQIFLNSNSSGKIFLGKDGSSGDDGAAVQHMVLAGELKKIMEDLIDAINLQVYLTPCGPTAVGPVNAPTFTGIRNRLKVFYSARNFLAKS